MNEILRQPIRWRTLYLQAWEGEGKEVKIWGVFWSIFNYESVLFYSFNRTMPNVGDIVVCKRCGKKFSLVLHKLAQQYCDDCKFIKDKEYDREYYNLYKRSGKKTGRPKKQQG